MDETYLVAKLDAIRHDGRVVIVGGAHSRSPENDYSELPKSHVEEDSPTPLAKNTFDVIVKRLDSSDVVPVASLPLASDGCSQSHVFTPSIKST